MADLACRFRARSSVVEISNGVDTEYFTLGQNDLPASPVRIGAVRRLVAKNGVQYLIEALRSYLEERARRIGVDSYVRFFSEVPNERVRDVLKEMHIVVFPSSAESTSIAALEAMSMGKPIVASALGPYRKLIGQNERGLLVKLFDRESSDYHAPLTLPEDRIRALASTILRLIETPAMGAVLGRAARDYVCKNFDWRRISGAVEQVYAGVGQEEK
jgi:glycosyltransferase involved in cell wall biosynthesis